MALYLFKTPTVPAMIPPGRLWRFFASEVSISVLKNGTSYIQVQIPDTEQLEAADVVYLGGYQNIVDADEAAALADAGYASNLFDIDTGLPLDYDPAGYGMGGYGSGGYGT